MRHRHVVFQIIDARPSQICDQQGGQESAAKRVRPRERSKRDGKTPPLPPPSSSSPPPQINIDNNLVPHLARRDAALVPACLIRALHQPAPLVRSGRPGQRRPGRRPVPGWWPLRRELARRMKEQAPPGPAAAGCEHRDLIANPELVHWTSGCGCWMCPFPAPRRRQRRQTAGTPGVDCLELAARLPPAADGPVPRERLPLQQQTKN